MTPPPRPTWTPTPRSWLSRASGGLRALLRRRQVEADLDEELHAFLAALAAEKMRAGLGEQDAWRAARLETGSLDAVKESVRAVGWEARLDTLWQDLRHGARVLARSPGSTAVALATLALGIGVNTAVFSLVAALWLRPLPVPDPGRLAVLAFQKHQGTIEDQFSHAHYEDLLVQTRDLFSGLAGFQYGIDGLRADSLRADSLRAAGTTERLLANYVTGDFFTVLGLQPALGRLLRPAEGRVPGADPVVVLSHSCWRTRFAGDPGVVGRKVFVNGHPVTVAGVAPAGFHGVRPLLDVQVYLPLAMAVPLEGFSPGFLSNRAIRNLVLVARLRPGIPLARARAALALAAGRLARQHPASDGGLRLHLYAETAARPRPQSGGRTALVARLFLGLAALVLALAWLNAADLVLLRTAARERELVVRSALGAGRRRLARQLLTENLLLGGAAGLAGAAAGAACGRAASGLRLGGDQPLLPGFAFDWRFFAYAAGAAVATGLAVGLAPALHAARGNLAAALRSGGGRGLATGRRRLRDALVAAQVGGALTLLVAAGLLARTLEGARRQQLGFDADQVLDVSLDAAAAGIPEEQGRRLYDHLLARVRVLPGVAAASLAAAVPMGDGYYENTLLIPAYLPPPGQPPPLCDYDMVSPGYFEALRIPLLAGRAFTADDDRGAPLVAVVNRTFAQRFWPRADPLGRSFAMASHPEAVFRVVGVAADSRNAGTGAIDPFFYVPLAQRYDAAQVLHVRTVGPPAALLPAVRRALASAAPALLVGEAGTLRGALGGRRGFLFFELGAGLAAALGLLGLALAVLGVYGVVACSAGQRRQEIGLRIALGADPAAIVAMMLRQGMATVGLGLAAGALAALGAARLLRTFLVGVSPTDPLTYGAATLGLALVALAACYLPARRSTRVDPARVLRCD